MMAAVIDFATRRARGTHRRPVPAPAPLPASTVASSDPAPERWWKFKPKPTPKNNPRNRYDAAFKGVMSKRASQLINELQIATYRWQGDLAECDARINWVIGEIRKIHDEVTRTTPEHLPPAS